MTALVVDIGRGYLWVERGQGWVLRDGAWHPVTEAEASSIGGHVLTRGQVAELVLEHGRPEATA